MGGRTKDTKCHKAVVSYKACYPSKDVEGNALTSIKGLLIEVLEPGECDWKVVGELEWPEMLFDYVATHDGAYAFRHRAITWSVTQDVEVGTCSAYGEPSKPVKVTIDVAPPLAPPAGGVIVPCPEHNCE